MTDQDKIEKRVGLVFQHVARLRSRYFDQKLATHGLTSAQVYALNYLIREDGLTQVELARYLGIGTVAVSGLIDRLEAAHWVIRKPDSRDRRSNRIWLLPAAEEKKQALRESADAVNAASMAGLTPAEIDQLLTMMHKIRKNLLEALKDDPEIVLPPSNNP
jgi:MarR family transcriptional regulator, transcriptional regulator for hemolysin